MIKKVYFPKPVKAKIPLSLAVNQKMMLVPMGDIHYGAEGFPLKAFKDSINWYLDRGCCFLGMGEPFDFTSHTQRSQMAPLRDKTKKQIDGYVSYQVESLCEVLAPTKGRWIGMVEGDHYWTFSDATTSDQKLCRFLGCDFLGSMGFIRIGMGLKGHPEADTRVVAHHGIGSSRTVGGHLHRVEDLKKFFEADIFLMGHSHAKLPAPTDRQCISPDGVHYHRTEVIGRTGAWLRQYLSHDPLSLDKPAVDSRGTYAEKFALMPASLGCLMIAIGYEQIHDSDYYRPALHCSV